MTNTDVDRQIDLAKRKPLTAENLNYIGDLYLKKNDKQRAVAYFFEACDKLHFAQKEKKIAIYKKILNISPVSEKAYLGIIEILSKMGLVMEEKKFLHMLAQLYENRGDAAKAAELFDRIKELDPHVRSYGTFFHPEAHRAVIDSGEAKGEEGDLEEKDLLPLSAKSARRTDDAQAAAEMQQEKLIEATLEEILPEESYQEARSTKWQLRPRYLFGGALLLILFLGSVLFFFQGRDRENFVPLLPLSTSTNDYEITLSKLNDLAELKASISKNDLDNADFLELTVKSRQNCLPDAFATLPVNMISLLDRKGGATLVMPMKGLQQTTRTISRMNTCGRDNAVVFVRTIIALDRHTRYSGLAINGLQTEGPLTISWDSR